MSRVSGCVSEKTLLVIDELSAELGELSALYNFDLIDIQQTLIYINSVITSPLQTVLAPYSQSLEQGIAIYNSKLPNVDTYLIFSQYPLAAKLNRCRTLARKVEYELYQLPHANSDVVNYMALLSDFLFSNARYILMVNGYDEIIYEKSLFNA